MTRNMILFTLSSIAVCFFVGQAVANSIDSSDFWEEEAEKYYRHFTDRDLQRVPSEVLNIRCTTDRWTRPRGLNKWWNTKICCIDIGCCEKSDKENYPNIEAENCMRAKIRSKVPEESAEINRENSEESEAPDSSGGSVRQSGHISFEGDGSTRLYIRPFDGDSFGQASLTKGLSRRDSHRGWSWDGSAASYIVLDSDGSTRLYIRPFDGDSFRQVSLRKGLSRRDSHRGWSWDGSTASYIVFDSDGNSTLYVRPFNGRTFGNVTTRLRMSQRDDFRGWSWNGSTASYLAYDPNSGTTLYIRPFNGESFGRVISRKNMGRTDRFRGWNW